MQLREMYHFCLNCLNIISKIIVNWFRSTIILPRTQQITAKLTGDDVLVSVLLDVLLLLCCLGGKGFVYAVSCRLTFQPLKNTTKMLTCYGGFGCLQVF